jgi:hypothetical protein
MRLQVIAFEPLDNHLAACQLDPDPVPFGALTDVERGAAAAERVQNKLAFVGRKLDP